jgi:predicted acyl esterase
MYPTSVLLRKGHRIQVALAGADASLFERHTAEGTHKLTVHREAQRASYLDLPVKTHDP